MTGLPEFFTQTSDKSYDRHKYKLHMESGKVEIVEWYDEVYSRWIQSPYCKSVEVIDRKKRR
jgi:hypothetical protein